MTIRAMFVVPTLVRDGAETQLVNLINQLDSRRIAKYLFTFDGELLQLGRVDRHSVTHFDTLRRGKLDPGPSMKLARLVDENDIDVVHCTLQFALLVGWLGVQLSRRKPSLIVAVHTTLNRNRKNELLDRLLYQWLMRQCSSIIFVCDAQRKHWIQKFPALSRLASTVHNGVDIAHFVRRDAREAGKILRHELKIPDDALVFAHVAAFRPEKGHAILLDAFQHVLRIYPSAVLIFAGDGMLRGAIENSAINRGLQGNVRFLGSVRDTRPVYGVADSTVLPSTGVETFSMAMLESLALEVPMIASDIGGASEAILDGRTGLLVPPADVDRLAEAMLTLASDHTWRQQMGRQGRRVVEERFTEEVMVDKTQLLLEQTVTLRDAHQHINRDHCRR